jgi:hypothetical protein
MIFNPPGDSMRPSAPSVLFAVLLLFALVFPRAADAQLGGLIKKAVSQATAGAQGGEPVKFDSVVLEITADRITRVTAGRRAARQYADGPNGPAAHEARFDSLDARQAAIYEKEVHNINAWDGKRMEHGACLDSAFSALRDEASDRTPDSQRLQKMMELGLAMAAAQQRGDTAEARRILDALEQQKAPSRADSLAALKACGPVPAQSAIIRQWYELKARLDTLGSLEAAAEDSVRAIEQRISGMSPRQSAVLCERIKLYVEQLKARKQGGFTDAELKTMAGMAQAVRDLDALCP